LKDLFVLVADESMEKTVQTILEKRRESLGIKNITKNIMPHPLKDPGVYSQGVEFCRNFQREYAKFIIILDFKFSGSQRSPEEMREEMIDKAKSCGFSDNNFEIIVISPELEAWIWKSRRHMASLVGWDEGKLNDWLKKTFNLHNNKPKNPKEVYLELLRVSRTQKSSDNFSKMAGIIGFKDCQDPAFNSFQAILLKWFKA